MNEDGRVNKYVSVCTSTWYAECGVGWLGREKAVVCATGVVGSNEWEREGGPAEFGSVGGRRW